MLMLLSLTVLFLLLFGITTFKPGVGLVGANCIYGLEQWLQTQSVLFVKYGTFINIIMGVVILYSLIVMILHNRNPFKNFPTVGWLVWGLLVLSYVSYFWTISSVDTGTRLAKILPYVVTYAFLTPLIIQRPADLRDGLMATMLLGGLIVTGIAFTGSYQGRALILQTYKGVGNPLALGSLGGVVAIITAMYKFDGLTKVMQILRWGLVAFALYVLLRSQSRGQFIALLTAMLVFLPIARQINLKSTKAITTLASMLIFVVLAGLFFQQIAYEENPKRWSAEQFNNAIVGGRIHYIMQLMDHWIDSNPFYWLLGLGSGAFTSIGDAHYPHNVPAEVLGELGVVGFSLLLAIYWFAIRSIVRLIRWTKDYPFERSIFTAAAALFTFYFVLSLKEGSLQGHSSFFATAIILGRMETTWRPYMMPAQRPVYVPPAELSDRGAAYGTW